MNFLVVFAFLCSVYVDSRYIRSRRPNFGPEKYDAEHPWNQTTRRNHPIPTYFRMKDADGNLISHQSAEYYDGIPREFDDRIDERDLDNVVMKVLPIIVENGGQVTVSWSGIKDAGVKDFVGFYCPADDDSTHTVDYWHVQYHEGWKTGNASVTINVFNMRSECEFRYFRSDSYAKLVAKSNRFTFKNGGPVAPLQGHISSTGNPTEMRVMWVSAKVEHPLVRYGLTKELTEVQTVGVMDTYKMEDMCEYPATDKRYFIDPGYIYDFVMVGLKPNTRYFYSFGTEEYMSSMFNFTSDLPAGDLTPYTFIMYGDMGVAEYPQAQGTRERMAQELQENKIRYFIHDGDISYARGSAHIWEQWHQLVEPFATLAPYMLNIGNHEYDHWHGGEKDPSGATGQGWHPSWGNYGSDSGGECSVPMYYRFTMPKNGNSLYWYSFEYGLVHNIMMSTEHDFRPGSPQYNWMEKDLKSIDRKRTPWVTVSGHRGMYCSQAEADWYVVKNFQKNMEPLLLKYGVDLGFWAHYHLYERTCKVNNFTCVTDNKTPGIVHLVSGAAGAGLDNDVWVPNQKWSIMHFVDWGYGRVFVANHTHLQWQFVQNRLGTVADEFWLIKPDTRMEN